MAFKINNLIAPSTQSVSRFLEISIKLFDLSVETWNTLFEYDYAIALKNNILHL